MYGYITCLDMSLYDATFVGECHHHEQVLEAAQEAVTMGM